MSVKMQKQAAPKPDGTDALRIYPSSSNFADVAMAAIDPDNNVLRFGGTTVQDYRHIRTLHILNGTTTYTPTAGTRALFVECWGAGGAGGGGAAGVSQAAVGGGGGGGAYSAAWLITNISGAHTVAIGAGGTVGTAGNNPGNAGGDTTFKDNAGTNVVVAKGGSGGTGETATTAIRVGAAPGAGGLASGGTGDIKVDGNNGKYGLALTATGTQLVESVGGAGVKGLGGAQRSVGTPAAGATNFGAGGSGATPANNTVAGGAGFNGLIRIKEYA